MKNIYYSLIFKFNIKLYVFLAYFKYVYYFTDVWMKRKYLVTKYKKKILCRISPCSR